MFKTILTGNLTADPVLNERTYTDKETGEVIHTKVCNFTVAADEGYGARKTTEFIRVNAWREFGETCAKFLKKGRGVLVEGKISQNSYVDKNKNWRSVLELRADSVEFLKDGRRMTDEEVVGEADTEETPY